MDTETPEPEPTLELLVIAVCPACGRRGLRARPGTCVGLRRALRCSEIAKRRADRARRTEAFRRSHVRRGKTWEAYR